MRHTSPSTSIGLHGRLPAAERELYWKLFSAAFVALGGTREEAAREKVRLDPSKSGQDPLFYHYDPMSLASTLRGNAEISRDVVRGIYAALAPHLLEEK